MLRLETSLFSRTTQRASSADAAAIREIEQAVGALAAGRGFAGDGDPPRSAPGAHVLYGRPRFTFTAVDSRNGRTFSELIARRPPRDCSPKSARSFRNRTVWRSTAVQKSMTSRAPPDVFCLYYRRRRPSPAGGACQRVHDSFWCGRLDRPHTNDQEGTTKTWLTPEFQSTIGPPSNRRANITRAQNASAEVREKGRDACSACSTHYTAVAEKLDVDFAGHEWLKKAVLAVVPHRGHAAAGFGPAALNFYDKVPLESTLGSGTLRRRPACRVVPPATCCGSRSSPRTCADACDSISPPTWTRHH